MPAVQAAGSGASSCMKVLGDCYELYIRLPPGLSGTCSLAILSGRLYVYRTGQEALLPGKADMCFMIPADADQSAVKAFRERFGLRLVMPLAPQPAGLLPVALAD